MLRAGVPFLATAAVAAVFERLPFRRLYRAGELNQVLFTIGTVFSASAVFAHFFGTTHQLLDLPGLLTGHVEVAAVKLPAYRPFLVAVALAVTGLVVWGLAVTRFGAMVRAAVDNQRVAAALGLNVGAIFALTFAAGSGLAGLGGALAIEVPGLDPSFGFHILVFVLIVVAVGGMGSVRGRFLAATLLGVLDVAGKYFIPEIGSFLMYGLKVAILSFRPRGIFAKR